MGTADSEKRDMAFEMLKSGMKHSEIASKLDLSIDQVKRLSRLRSILEITRGQISNDAYIKLDGLGFKALELSKTVKKSDFEGVADIMSSMSQNVLKKDIRLYVNALEQKNRHVNTEASRLELSLNQLNHSIETYETQVLILRKTSKKQKEIKKAIRSCENRHVKKFLEDHIGFYQGHIALKRRIDSGWLEELVRDGIVEFKRGTEKYYRYDVRVILDFEGFVKNLEARYKSGKKVRRQPVWIWWTPKPLDYDTEKECSAHLEKIKELKNRKATCIEKFKNIKNAPLDDFMNERKDTNWPHDPKIIQAVARYFCNMGYAVVLWDENTLLGYNEEKSIIAARLPDHRHEKNIDWKGIKNMCERKYEIRTGWISKSDEHCCGIIKISGDKRLKVEIVCESPVTDLDANAKKNIVFEIARKASRKMVFG